MKAAARVLTGYRVADRGDWTASYDRAPMPPGRCASSVSRTRNKQRDGRRVTRKPCVTSPTTPRPRSASHTVSR